jgi:predicted nucleotide-binding protein
MGAPKDKPNELKPRARQNVIFELGYFVGKLGRNRVCALHKEEVEIPSDFQGVLYVPMDSSSAWRFLLAKEIKQAGMEVDLNKAL